MSYDAYTKKAQEAFLKIKKDVIGIHTFENPSLAVEKVEAIFVGGGNTFVLLNQLYKKQHIKCFKRHR